MHPDNLRRLGTVVAVPAAHSDPRLGKLGYILGIVTETPVCVGRSYWVTVRLDTGDERTYNTSYLIPREIDSRRF